MPLLRCCSHQHRSCAGTCFTHGQPQVFDAGRATGEHQPHLAHGFAHQPLCAAFHHALVVRVKRQSIGHTGQVVVNIVLRRLLKTHLLPTRIQFFGQQHGQTSEHALPHFRFAHYHRDAVVVTNANPAIQGRGFVDAG